MGWFSAVAAGHIEQQDARNPFSTSVRYTDAHAASMQGATAVAQSKMLQTHQWTSSEVAQLQLQLEGGKANPAQLQALVEAVYKSGLPGGQRGQSVLDSSRRSSTEDEVLAGGVDAAEEALNNACGGKLAATCEDCHAAVRQRLQEFESHTHDSAASTSHLAGPASMPSASTCWAKGVFIPAPAAPQPCVLDTYPPRSAKRAKFPSCARPSQLTSMSSMDEDTLALPDLAFTTSLASGKSVDLTSHLRVEWPEAVAPWSGKYVWKPEEVVGKGGWSVVLPCRRRDSPEGQYDLAVKVTRFQDEAHAYYLRHEAAVLRKLAGTRRVVGLDNFYMDHAGGTAYLIMERLRGRSLRALMAASHNQHRGVFLLNRSPLDIARHHALVKEVAVELLKGLAAIHTAGIAHLDVKQGNLMVSIVGDRLRVHLIDFGCAFDMTTGWEMDDDVGTVDYESPEVLQAWINRRTGQGPTVLVNPAAADVWSAGITLIEALFDGVPFSAAGGADPFQQQCEVKALHREWAAALRGGAGHWVLRDLACLGPEAVDFYVRMLAIDPAQRMTAQQALRHPYLACEPQ